MNNCQHNVWQPPVPKAVWSWVESHLPAHLRCSVLLDEYLFWRSSGVSTVGITWLTHSPWDSWAFRDSFSAMGCHLLRPAYWINSYKVCVGFFFFNSWGLFSLSSFFLFNFFSIRGKVWHFMIAVTNQVWPWWEYMKKKLTMSSLTFIPTSFLHFLQTSFYCSTPFSFLMQTYTSDMRIYRVFSWTKNTLQLAFTLSWTHTPAHHHPHSQISFAKFLFLHYKCSPFEKGEMRRLLPI